MSLDKWLTPEKEKKKKEPVKKVDVEKKKEPTQKPEVEKKEKLEESEQKEKKTKIARKSEVVPKELVMAKKPTQRRSSKNENKAITAPTSGIPSNLKKFELVCSKPKCGYRKTFMKAELTEKDKICRICKSEMKIKKTTELKSL